MYQASADTLIAHVAAALRMGYIDEVAREHQAGLLEQARAIIREIAPTIPSSENRRRLVGRESEEVKDARPR